MHVDMYMYMYFFAVYPLQSFLYGGERTEFVTFSDFINKELILFSNADNERSIPSVVDGEKKREREREIKLIN